MDLEERKAAFAVARAEAYEVSLARHAVTPKPEPPPLPPRTYTDSEISNMIASVQADISSKIAAVDRRFAALQAKESEMLKGIGMALVEGVTEVRNQLHCEILTEVGQLRAEVAAEQRQGGEVVDMLQPRGARRA
jgi:hypothetical protein